MKLPEIIIYTDGSSRGNPGPGGWGAIIAYDNGESKSFNGRATNQLIRSRKSKVTEIGGGDKHTTNNKMELTAAIESLFFVKSLSGSHTIDMHVDSQYVINGITKWVVGWQKNGWKNSKKEDVLNRDLWETLARVVADLKISGCKILWKYTPGHAGIDGNDRADLIATAFADDDIPKLFNGDRSEYKVDLVPHAGDPKLLALKKTKSKSKNGAKAYSYLSLVNGKLERHSTWAECEKRVKGVKGTKFKKSVSADDERAIINGWGM